MPRERTVDVEVALGEAQCKAPLPLEQPRRNQVLRAELEDAYWCNGCDLVRTIEALNAEFQRRAEELCPVTYWVAGNPWETIQMDLEHVFVVGQYTILE